MRIEDNVIIIEENDWDIRLTTKNGNGMTCIYISLDSNGKLVLQGGSGIVGRIEGKGFVEKLTELE